MRFSFFKAHVVLPGVHYVKQIANQRGGFFTFLFTKVFIVCFILQTPPLELFPSLPPKRNKQKKIIIIIIVPPTETSLVLTRVQSE